MSAFTITPWPDSSPRGIGPGDIALPPTQPIDVSALIAAAMVDRPGEK